MNTFAPPRETKNPFAEAKVIGRNVSPADYFATDWKRGEPGYVMSRGELMEFNHCPSRWLAGYQRKDTDATEWGSLMDALLFGQFQGQFAVEPSVYPVEPTKKDPRTEKKWNNNATFCREWTEEREAEGRTIVSHKDMGMAKDAIKVLREERIDGQFEYIGNLIASSDTQVHVTAEYHDEVTGLVIPVKCLLDLVPPADSDFGKTLLDFKTCFTAATFAWPRAVFDHHYAEQAALYMDCYTAATGEDRNTWLHLLQESYAPWQVGKRFLSAEFIEIGRVKYVAALERYAACLQAGVWPSYEGGTNKINWNGFEIVEPEPFMYAR